MGLIELIAAHQARDAPSRRRQERGQRHGDGDRGQDETGKWRRDEVQGGSEPQADEGEFAAGTEEQAGFDRRRPRQAEQLAERRQHHRLDRDQTGDAGEQQ